MFELIILAFENLGPSIILRSIYIRNISALAVSVHVRIQRAGQGVRTPPLKNHKNIGFHIKTGPDLKKHKATKPTFNVGPSPARQRNAI